MKIFKIFKKIWYRFWCAHLHWHNGKGATPKLDLPLGNKVHSICSRCGKAVVLDGQDNWLLK